MSPKTFDRDTLPKLDADTKIVIRRHPFGLVALYLEVIVGLSLAFGLSFFLVSEVVDNNRRPEVFHWLSIIVLIIASLAVIILILAAVVYRQNQWIVTQDNITQVLQIGLFRRQTSELTMANIEDVTAEQIGFLAELFNFGALKCETAGELPYFKFLYCPNPNFYGKIILAARQDFIKRDPAAAKRANDLLNLKT